MSFNLNVWRLSINVALNNVMTSVALLPCCPVVCTNPRQDMHSYDGMINPSRLFLRNQLNSSRLSSPMETETDAGDDQTGCFPCPEGNRAEFTEKLVVGKWCGDKEAESVTADGASEINRSLVFIPLTASPAGWRWQACLYPSRHDGAMKGANNEVPTSGGMKAAESKYIRILRGHWSAASSLHAWGRPTLYLIPIPHSSDGFLFFFLSGELKMISHEMWSYEDCVSADARSTHLQNHFTLQNNKNTDTGGSFLPAVNPTSSSCGCAVAVEGISLEVEFSSCFFNVCSVFLIFQTSKHPIMFTSLRVSIKSKVSVQ